MRVDDFDFHLPPERIAGRPAQPRDSARLMVYERSTQGVRHLRVRDLPDLLRVGDLLVVNDTRVLPHRLLGRRAGGGRLEALLTERSGTAARGYLRPAKKVRTGEWLSFEGGELELRPIESLGGGMFDVELRAGNGESGDVDAAIERVGRAPLPPYIARGDRAEDRDSDRADYQTVFATEPGAIAAPTAGLHFTPALLAGLAERGVERAAVTLHVGVGTFAPVRVERVEDHEMHPEVYELPEATAAAIAATRARNGRVLAVGTTSVRTLETCASPSGGRRVESQRGESSLFLYPGRPIQVVDGFLTNFHLPQSTLLMLVAAFIGREKLLELYDEAITEGYRFYSFGDAMLVL